MRSIDFLDMREVLQECLLYALAAFVATLAVGGLAWVSLRYFGRTADSEASYALVGPFFLAAIYGNIGLYNIRWKHGIRPLRSAWWWRIAGTSILWTVGFTAMALAVGYALGVANLVPRQPHQWQESLAFVGGAACFAVVVSLLPANEQYQT
jgi:hypothetical protein